jgi:hypothetical protein
MARRTRGLGLAALWLLTTLILSGCPSWGPHPGRDGHGGGDHMGMGDSRGGGTAGTEESQE